VFVELLDLAQEVALAYLQIISFGCFRSVSGSAMAAAVSPFRTPWTAALLLLLVIWTVWLLGMPASTRVLVGMLSTTMIVY
jgi:hypothetical protein